MKRLHIFAAIAAGLALAACSTPPEIPYDHSTSAVRTIGVVTPGFPSGPTVYLASDVGQSFGLVGGLIDASMQSNRESKFSAIMTAQNFAAPDEFSRRLNDAIRQDGYSVVPIAVVRDKSDFMKQYPASGQPVDAYLDVIVGDYGYMAAGIGDSTPYRPIMGLTCKLVRASDSVVLMQESIKLNPLSPSDPLGLVKPAKQVTLSPDPDYQFPTFDDLARDPKKATEGVSGAFVQTISTLATLLK